MGQSYGSLCSMRRRGYYEGEIEGVFDELAGAPNSGLIVPADIFSFIRSPTVVALAAKYRVPAIYAVRRFAVDGGFVAYGLDLSDQELELKETELPHRRSSFLPSTRAAQA